MQCDYLDYKVASPTDIARHRVALCVSNASRIEWSGREVNSLTYARRLRRGGGVTVKAAAANSLVVCQVKRPSVIGVIGVYGVEAAGVNQPVGNMPGTADIQQRSLDGAVQSPMPISNIYVDNESGIVEDILLLTDIQRTQRAIQHTGTLQMTSNVNLVFDAGGERA